MTYVEWQGHGRLRRSGEDYVFCGKWEELIWLSIYFKRELAVSLRARVTAVLSETELA
jgi:hypothetical protein